MRTPWAWVISVESACEMDNTQHWILKQWTGLLTSSSFFITLFVTKTNESVFGFFFLSSFVRARKKLKSFNSLFKQQLFFFFFLLSSAISYTFLQWIICPWPRFTPRSTIHSSFQKRNQRFLRSWLTFPSLRHSVHQRLNQSLCSVMTPPFSLIR